MIGRWATGLFAAAMLTGMVAAGLLGEPLIAILLAGVLLLFPLLGWLPSGRHAQGNDRIQRGSRVG